jgi:hypothetical protein
VARILGKNMRVLLSAAIVVFLAPAGRGVPVRAQQSLAEVAKQEEARRKTVKPVGRVLTNKDLGSAPTAAVTPPPPDAPKVAEPAKPPDAALPEEKTPVRDQAYWAARMKDLRVQLDRDQIFAESLQTRINSLTADFVNRDDPAQRAVIDRDRQRALGELERLKKAIEDGRKAIAGLEEDARRAGVPPGWLR